MNRRIATVAALALVGLLSACSGGIIPEPTKDPRPVPETISAPAGIVVAPLTGKLVPAGQATAPSLAVKIDNHVDARPHIAIDQTDIVFEELVEGGLTRYVAIWQSTVPTDLGPVRSIRPMDPDIITPFGGLVAYSGGQTQFVEMMQNTPVVNLVFDYDDGTYFYRLDDREAPHNVILKAQVAVANHADLAKPARQFVYGGPVDIASMPGTPTTSIALSFSSARYPSWSWDAASGTWLRSQEDAPDLAASGAQISAVNVVTMRVDIDRASYNQVPKTIMVGSGEAFVSVAGMTVKGRWSKAGQDQPIVLTLDDGSTPMYLAPGNTWVELVPNDTGSANFG